MKFKRSLHFFVAFIIALAAVLSSCGQSALITPSPAITQESSQTPSSTLAPTAAPTPMPSPTPTLPYFGGGMLTLAQKQRLAQTSLEFTASTEADAIQVARSLKFLVNEGHPASMCGPLSIAILQRAGLLDPAVDRHLFWKLNPRPDVDLPLLEATFPRSSYEWISVRAPIQQFDFAASPLYPGDLLYLYAGDAGSFEHVLVVTRVDEEGRAFSVNNHQTNDGYLISELMLYDPTQPGIGAFYDWTNRELWRLGLTGFGGFDLWRPSRPISDPTVEQSALQSSWQSVMDSTGGRWNILFKEIGGETHYARLENESLHPASTIKVPIAMLFFQALLQSGVTDLQGYISTHAIDNRPVEELLRSMLVFSEEDATQILMSWSVKYVNFEKVFHSWGIDRTMLTPRRSTVLEIARFLEVLYTGEALTPDARGIILDLLAERTTNDDLRLGSLQKMLGSTGLVYNKRGTMTADWLIVADAAIITYNEKAYVLVMIGQPAYNESSPTYEQLEAAFTEMVPPLWEFLQADQ